MTEYKLRPWTKDDLESLFKHACNENITKFMSDGFPNTKDKCKRFLEFATDNDSILYFAIDINSQAVGGIGVSPGTDIKRKNAELGYWISEDYWGQGIMTNAIKEIIKIAFNRYDIDRIYAAPFESNTASHRILEKNGFKLEARFEKNVYKYGAYLDELIYAIRR